MPLYSLVLRELRQEPWPRPLIKSPAQVSLIPQSPMIQSPIVAAAAHPSLPTRAHQALHSGQSLSALPSFQFPPSRTNQHSSRVSRAPVSRLSSRKSLPQLFNPFIQRNPDSFYFYFFPRPSLQQILLSFASFLVFRPCIFFVY